jgi:hypothetical protein
MPRKSKLDDRSPAPKAEIEVVTDGDEIAGKAHMWPVRRFETLVLAEWTDGELTAFIQEKE